jgi:Divergent InlB B-repeat domain
MTAIRYGNLRVELLVGHGTRLDRIAFDTSAPHLRPRDLEQVASVTSTQLLGRVDLLDRLAGVVRPGWAVELRGPCGFGKSSLLTALTARLVDTTGAPLVRLWAGGLSPDDLLDQLAGALYTADQPVRPTPEQRTSLLTQARAVVVLDDLILESDWLDELLATLPQCLVLLASEQPVLDAGGVSVPLGGLAEAAALQLVARDLGRPLEQSERDDAARLCAAVHGQPLRLRQAAALAASGEQTLRNLADRAERDPALLDRLSVHALADTERRVLAALALAAGALLPGDLVEVISGVNDIAEQLSKLRRHGLVEQDRDRFGLPRCLGAGYRRLLAANLDAGAVARPLTAWLAQRDPGSADSLGAVNAAVQLIGILAERGDWPELARLAEVTARVLTLAGRWNVCWRVLQHGLHAAEQLGDLAAQARFAHDLGSIALCTDQLQQAEDLLRRALHLREQLGDHEGAALTRHNLELMRPPMPRPPRRGRRKQPDRHGGWRERWRKRLPALASLVGLFAFLLILVWRMVAPALTTTNTTTPRPNPSTTTSTSAPPPRGSTTVAGGPFITAPASVRFPPTAIGTTATQVFPIGSSGTRPLRLGAFELTGDTGDFTVDDRCRHTSLPAGNSCRPTVQFTPIAEGSRDATLVIHQNLRGPATHVRLIGTGLPALPQRTFTVTVQTLSKDLRVSSDPHGINCPEICQASFVAGTTVTLRAATGSGTVVWDGACAGAVDSCQLAVNSDRKVQVSVKPRTVTLTVTVSGTGTVSSSPPGIECTPSSSSQSSPPTITCERQFPAGTNVTLTATPSDPTKQFSSWAQPCKESEPTCKLTLRNDTTIKVSFKFQVP